jgi:multiple sugar transport system permease protein
MFNHIKIQKKFFKAKRPLLLNSVFLIILSGIAIAAIFPLLLTIINSFMSESEISAHYSSITGLNAAKDNINSLSGYASIKLIPDIATLAQYFEILVKKPYYLIMFWNSIKMVLPIVIGQLVVASMAAYAFAKIRFKGKNLLFFIYIIVMMMPFQVTLVPNYLVADMLGLIGSRSSIILPGIFSAFGVFLLKQNMEGIPYSYMEAAKVDGATQFNIFMKIIIPMSKTGIWALIILLFIDYWNMVEQPLIFLKDALKMPLSIFLSNISDGERGIAFAASTLYMAPMLLVFLYGENYLIKGIQLSGLKQ